MNRTFIVANLKDAKNQPICRERRLEKKGAKEPLVIMALACC
jgi:hypothetical protein